MAAKTPLCSVLEQDAFIPHLIVAYPGNNQRIQTRIIRQAEKRPPRTDRGTYIFFNNSITNSAFIVQSFLVDTLENVVTLGEECRFRAIHTGKVHGLETLLDGNRSRTVLPT